MMRVLQAMIAFVLIGLLSCQDSPPTSGEPAPPGPVADTYMGYGDLGSGIRNIRLELTATDTLGSLSGTILYRGDEIALESLHATSAGDSVFFEFVRGEITYDVRGRVTSSSIVIEIVEPAGLAAVQLNRQIQGYNMSGLWVGQMSHSTLGVTRTATMQMDQAGSLFYGLLDVSFLQSRRYTLTTGVLNLTDFVLRGDVRIGVDEQETSMTGSFTSDSRIEGTWTAGPPEHPEESGAFVLVRSY